jgi:hypothetical protein
MDEAACFLAGVLIGAGVCPARKWFFSRPALFTALWNLAAAPVALLWVVALSVFPAAVLGALPTGEFTQFATYSIVLVLLSIVLYGLVCYRPFGEPRVPNLALHRGRPNYALRRFGSQWWAPSVS